MFAPVEKPADLPSDRLASEIAALYSRISADTCRWLELIAELDQRQAYLDWGAKTCAEWLSWHCGVATRAGQEQVKVARRLGDLELVRDAFARGELSYSKVRALARVADAESEASLLELARDMTAAQLERTVSAYRRASDVPDPEALAEHRFAELRWDDDGCLSVRARLSPEEGATLMKAMEQAREELWRERDDDCVRAESEREPVPLRPARTANADALVRVGEGSLAAPASGATGGDATQVVIHVDVDHPEIENGPGITQEAARRLACDASVVVMRERDGEPLSVERKTRTIPPAIRRALRSRDRGCRFPGCTADRFVDAHHIQHWAHGGATKLTNLVTLCRHHHRLVHEGGFRIEAGAPGELVFRRPDGAALPAAPMLPGAVEPARPGASWEPALWADAPWVDPRGVFGPLSGCGPRHGRQPLDLEHTLFCLMQRKNQRAMGVEPPVEAARGP